MPPTSDQPDACRDRRGRGDHPPRPEGAPRGGGLRRRRRDRPRRRSDRARPRPPARPRRSSTSRCPGSTASPPPATIAGERLAAVLILTAFSQRELVEQARDAGALAYLVKPFQKSDLIPAIEIALGRFARARRRSSARSTTSQERLEARKIDRPGQGPADGRARHDRAGRLAVPPAAGDGQPRRKIDESPSRVVDGDASRPEAASYAAAVRSERTAYDPATIGRSCSCSTATRSRTGRSTRCPTDLATPRARSPTRCTGSRRCSRRCSPTSSPTDIAVVFDAPGPHVPRRPRRRLQGAAARRRPTSSCRSSR